MNLSSLVLLLLLLIILSSLFIILKLVFFILYIFELNIAMRYLIFFSSPVILYLLVTFDIISITSKDSTEKQEKCTMKSLINFITTSTKILLYIS